MGEVCIQRSLVVEHRYDAVKASNHAGDVSLEVRRLHVLRVDGLEQVTGGRGVVEDAAEQKTRLLQKIYIIMIKKRRRS